MPLTELSSTSALIVVDLQTGTTSADTAHPIAGVVSRSAALAKAFRAAGRPVFLAVFGRTPRGRTTYSDGGGATWPPELTQIVPGLGREATDIEISRGAMSVFSGSSLHEQLTGRGVTEVVIVGVATSFGVEATARQAYDLGYDVVVVSDAITDRSLAWHEHSVAAILPVVGRVTTTAELLPLIVQAD